MSKFRWRDLIDLNSRDNAYNSPLSCIAHIDVNAFFAQVEQVRCGYSRDDPVVAVQWSSILAISYAARKFNISRMDSIHDALKKCDKLIPIHTAVFRKGEDYWQYHDGWGLWVKDDKKKLDPANYKVALEPYRREGRKLIKLICSECDWVEKASVDEVFIDLGRNCFRMILIDERFNEFNDIRKSFRNGSYSLDDFLPAIPSGIQLEFQGTVFNPKDRPLFEDWDDIIFCMASICTKQIRARIDSTLGYTTSCGISSTKSTSKLASNFKKPDAQTVVKNSCIEEFLDCGSFEMNSFWTLGGIRGQELFSLVDLPTEGSIKFIRDSWPTESGELRKYLMSRLGTREPRTTYSITEPLIPSLSEKLFKLVRGDYKTVVQPRPLPKSMMSNKNMRNNDCNSTIDCLEWIEIFCSELNNRLHDLEQEYEKLILPKTMTISLKGMAGMKHAHSTRIKLSSRILAAKNLFINATKLMREIDDQYGKLPGVYPLRNLSMCISNFEVIEPGKSVLEMVQSNVMPKEKVHLLTDPQEINHEHDSNASYFSERLTATSEQKDHHTNQEMSTPKSAFSCEQCGAELESTNALQEHLDYHISVKLSETLNGFTKDSTNLSHAERILLFGKRSRKRTSQATVNPPGILKFFKK